MKIKYFKITKTISCILISLFMIQFFAFPISADDMVYTETETGISFTIPEGWSAIGVSDERKVVKEKFSTGEAGEILVFGAANLYNQLDSIQKSQYNKDSFIGVRFNKNQAKDLINDDSATYYGTKTLGEVEWHIFKYLNIYDYYVQTVNGNMIFFMFPSFMKDEREDQVLKVIEQVSIAEKEKEDNTLKSINNNDNINSKETNDLEEETNALAKRSLIWLAIIAVLLVIKHYKNK